MRIVLGLLLATLPLVFLGRHNLRAVPLGALFIITGLIIIGIPLAMMSEMIGSGQTPGPWIGGVLASLAVLGYLLFLNFRWVADSFGGRTEWLYRSLAAWTVSFFIYYIVPGPPINEIRERRKQKDYAAFMLKHEAERRAAAESFSATYRPDELAPSQRVAALEQVLREVEADHKGSPTVMLSRLKYFGDPFYSPASVIVWAIYQDVAHARFHTMTPTTLELRDDINAKLRALSYPSEVIMGATDEEMIREAGSDSRYFGNSGTLVEPQFRMRESAQSLADSLPPPNRRP